jgi:hypothetical protein
MRIRGAGFVDYLSTLGRVGGITILHYGDALAARVVFPHAAGALPTTRSIHPGG